MLTLVRLAHCMDETRHTAASLVCIPCAGCAAAAVCHCADGLPPGPTSSLLRLAPRQPSRPIPAALKHLAGPAYSCCAMLPPPAMPAAPKAYRGTKGRRGGYGGFSAFDLPQPQDPIQPGSTEMGAQWPGLDCLSAVQASSMLDGLLMLRWLCCVLVLCLEVFAETFAQLLCRTIPLPPAFVAGDNGRRYLAYNSLGAITLRQEEDHNVVEVRARLCLSWYVGVSHD